MNNMQGRIDRRLVPVTVLTGFLGAGKTTLLNHILHGDHGLKVAVLVNDFGAINIDAELIVGVESGGDIVSLANGCVCCNIRDDLVAALQQVIARPERPDYIVLEASGVADPSGIALTFISEAFRGAIRLDSIICVLDAAEIFSVPDLMKLKLLQIAYSDMLILNKIDLVGSDGITRIRGWLDEHFHRYRLIEAVRGDVPMPILLSSGRFDAGRILARPHYHPGHECHDEACTDHSQQTQVFTTWSYETSDPLSLGALREAVRKLPATIYRCKGVILSAEYPARRAVLQVVGKRVDISFDGSWEGAVPRTRIVVISAGTTVDAAWLEETFGQCRALPENANPD